MRVQSQRPPVQIFIRASTYELTKSPAQNPAMEASTMRQLLPNTVRSAGSSTAL